MRKLLHLGFVKLTIVATIVFFLIVMFSSCSSVDPTKELRLLRNGDMFPNLVLQNLDGSTFDLEFVEDEIVLVDFWASWCAPCRKIHPDLVEMYEDKKEGSYRGGEKGFRIVSVSFDDKRNNWINAIEKDQLSWPDQLSDGKAMVDSNLPMRYGFLQIPSSFLLDSSKRIIGREMSVKAIAYELSLRSLP